jgi:hypothetical protein
MGLDITAYSRLKHIGHHAFDPEFNEGEDGPWCYYENHVQAYAYDSFPQSFRGIPVLGERSGWDTSKFIEGGCFEYTPETQTHGFRAGSYGGYNVWRANLAEQFNPAPVTWDDGPSMQQPDPDLPFYELIWFADNEGCIGPEAALHLLADFDLHVNLYSPPEENSDWYRQKYEDWHTAFKLAADSGLVRFH